MDEKDLIEAGKVVVESTALAVAVKKVYPDALQPLTKQVGNTLETAGSLINTVLRPVKSAALGVNLVFDKVDAWLTEKLKNVPKEKIVAPPTNIAAPAMLQLAFISEDEEMNELRNLYVELLATAMNTDRRKLAHPAFVDIIKQMTPEEARMLQKIARDISSQSVGDKPTYPIIEYRRIDKGQEGYHPIGRIYTVDGDCGTLLDDMRPLDNFQRLGIITIDFTTYLSDSSRYEPLQNLKGLKSVEARAKKMGITVDTDNGTIQVTDFGRMFIIACTGITETKTPT
ncbi:DUF4393 domain-containing protein [Polyangium sp. 6x1]|uniref:DUF4393 domain-containing protein n=1 Tax=Polyangium sp. 6x1 TaxID=3042689 RepID=UPI0024827D52|nr:DUF4393 domain-containing protein [Polyangium sp. 6x1]MDI1446577.1 DUF4393 domain-containing protein [Polyangium sp. 6x1]